MIKCHREPRLEGEAISLMRLPRYSAEGGIPRKDRRKSRLQTISSLLFFFFIFSGFSLSSSKSGGRAFPLPGDFDEIWRATLRILQEEDIPIEVEDREQGYIRTASFPLYKKEYKQWAKAPKLSSSGFCALEIGIVEKDPTMSIVGIKAYFKRKKGFSTGSVFRKADKSRGVFEGHLGKRINALLVTEKFPHMKSTILGCNLYYDDKTAHYMITEAESHSFAYEQGLRNGDHLYKIDNQAVTPGNLFDFFLNINGEDLKKIEVVRKRQVVDLPIVIFHLNPHAPRLGFQVERDPKKKHFIITEVRAGSPAEQAGLLPGDIILQQNDFKLDSWKDYYRAILAQEETGPQAFQIQRGSKLLEKKIFLAPVSEVVL